MVRPLKVSEKTAPLSCDEHDINIDRLLDRGNHTGTQPSNTISDLSQTVEALSFIDNMKDQITSLTDKLNLFTDDVIRAELAYAIGVLRDQLQLRIDQLNSEITESENDLDTVFDSLDSIKSNILAIEAVIAVIPGLEQANNEFYLTFQQVWGRINAELSERAEADASLQTQIITEASVRQQEDQLETNTRLAGDAAVRNESITHTNNVHAILLNHINIQKKPKAWIVFNSYNGVVSENHGVSQLTKLGQGLWLINWGTAYNRQKYNVQVSACEWTYGGNPSPVIANIYAEDDITKAIPGFTTYISGSGGDGYIFASGVIIRLWAFVSLPTIAQPFAVDVPYVCVTAYD